MGNSRVLGDVGQWFPVLTPQSTPGTQVGEDRGWLLRGHGEGLGLTRLSSSGLEENSGLSERIWEGEERPGKVVRLPPALSAASPGASFWGCPPA